MCLIFNFFYLSNNIHMSTNKIFIISSGSSYLLSNISVLLSSNLNIPIQIIKNIPDGNINQSFLLKIILPRIYIFEIKSLEPPKLFAIYLQQFLIGKYGPNLLNKI